VANQTRRRRDPSHIDTEEARPSEFSEYFTEYGVSIFRRVQTRRPKLTRKTESSFYRTWRELCSNPSFQRDIVEFRAAASRDTTMWIEYAAKELCREWRIDDGESWVLSLLQNWDPTTTAMPTFPSLPGTFAPWNVSLEYQSDTVNGNPRRRRAVITLNGGISEREARNAVRYAIERITPDESPRGRPRLMEQERVALITIFNEWCITHARQRSKLIAHASAITGLSRSRVAAELRKWLKERGQIIKTYTRG